MLKLCSCHERNDHGQDKKIGEAHDFWHQLINLLNSMLFIYVIV
uniref:Uncharacterized protein n=1 Tax=Rhizophora mucronata TaxID=61149 RepID=A0A2P2M2Z1_RHIMU